MLTQLQTIRVLQVFSKSNRFHTDAQKLISMIDRMNSMYLGRKRPPAVQSQINRDLQDFFLYRKRKELLRIQRIDKMARAYLQKLNASKQDHMPDMDPKLVKMIIHFTEKIENPEMVAFKEFNKKIEQLKFKTLEIRKYLEGCKESIQYYVNWMFVNSRQTHPDLHLVFQGLGISMGYYHRAYTIIEDMIFESESKKTRELSFSITKDILQSAKRQGNSDLLKREGDLKYSLLKYVECNLHDL